MATCIFKRYGGMTWYNIKKTSQVCLKMLIYED